MPSTNKTPLGLNQWKLTDKPTMEDFNRDNGIIDDWAGTVWNQSNYEKKGLWAPVTYTLDFKVDDISSAYYELNERVYIKSYIRVSRVGNNYPNNEFALAGLPFPSSGWSGVSVDYLSMNFTNNSPRNFLITDNLLKLTAQNGGFISNNEMSDGDIIFSGIYTKGV